MATLKTAIQIVDGFSPAFKTMNNAMGVVMSSLANVQKQLGKPVDVSAITKAQQDLARVADQFDRMQAEAEQAANGQDKVNRSMQQGQGFASGLTDKIKGLVAAYASFQGIKALIGLTDTYTNITSRIDLMNDGLQTTAELENMIRVSANRTFSSYQATADMVGKLGIQAAGAFSNSEDIVNFAEQINKHLTISGTKGAAAEGAMIQLTQAMSNGVLRGEELNSVLDGMPTVANAIKQHFAEMGDTRGIKEIAEEGLITADIVKQALYETADETNKKFKEMGVTFADVWNVFGNYRDEALKPVFAYLGELSNSTEFQNFAKAAGSAFAVLGAAIVGVLDIASGLYNFISTNWSLIAPIVGTITAAVVAYTAATTALSVAKKIQNGLELISAIRTIALAGAAGLATSATAAQTVAQYGLNAAMLACPLTWIVAGIIAVIGVIYLMVAAFNKSTNASLSATGIIVGAFAYLGSAIWNIIAGVWNFILNVADWITNAFITVGEIVYNAFNGGFTGWIDGVKSAFWSLVDWIYQIVKPLIEVWDAFKGTNYAASLQNTITQKVESGTTDNYKKFDRSNIRDTLGLDYVDSAEAYKGGYDIGKSIGNSVKESLTFGQSAVPVATEQTAAQMMANANKTPVSTNGYGTALNQIANNTKKTADNTNSLAANDEELAYMRELGEREAVNRFTTAEIKLDIKNNNTIDKDMDIDSVISKLTSGLVQATSAFAEGSHTGG